MPHLFRVSRARLERPGSAAAGNDGFTLISSRPPPRLGAARSVVVATTRNAADAGAAQIAPGPGTTTAATTISRPSSRAAMTLPNRNSQIGCVRRTVH
jgi:hypothetical protein